MNTHKKRRNIPVLLCNTLSTLLLLLLIGVCLPLTAPRLFGYHIYTVISRSMEPAIPMGSLLYIKETEPSLVETGEVIAFYGAKDAASIVTHRVVENHVVMGEFITKGDANQTEDMNPIPYANFIGKVEKAYPKIGVYAQILTGKEGKFIAGGVIVAAMLMQVLASLLDRRAKKMKKE